MPSQAIEQSLDAWGIVDGDTVHLVLGRCFLRGFLSNDWAPAMTALYVMHRLQAILDGTARPTTPTPTCALLDGAPAESTGQIRTELSSVDQQVRLALDQDIERIAVTEPRDYSIKTPAKDLIKVTMPPGDLSVGDLKKEVADLELGNRGLDWMVRLISGGKQLEDNTKLSGVDHKKQIHFIIPYHMLGNF